MNPATTDLYAHLDDPGRHRQAAEHADKAIVLLRLAIEAEGDLQWGPALRDALADLESVCRKLLRDAE